MLSNCGEYMAAQYVLTKLILTGQVPVELQSTLTSPGSTVPTQGDTVSGMSSGMTNSNEVGWTAAIGPARQ